MKDYSIRHLAVFIHTMKSGSASRAGKTLGLSTTSCTRAIKQFEDYLNRPLFQRTQNNLIPTEYAYSLYPKSLDLYDTIRNFQNSTKNNAKKLSLFLSHSDWYYILHHTPELLLDLNIFIYDHGLLRNFGWITSALINQFDLLLLSKNYYYLIDEFNWREIKSNPSSYGLYKCKNSNIKLKHLNKTIFINKHIHQSQLNYFKDLEIPGNIIYTDNDITILHLLRKNLGLGYIENRLSLSSNLIQIDQTLTNSKDNLIIENSLLVNKSVSKYHNDIINNLTQRI
jgi:hypothetical protein